MLEGLKCLPLPGVVLFLCHPSGGIAALNHRLMAEIPPGSKSLSHYFQS